MTDAKLPMADLRGMARDGLIRAALDELTGNVPERGYLRAGYVMRAIEHLRAALGVKGDAPHADTTRLDYLQRTGSTVELLPGFPGDPLQFRIGGLRTAVDADLRAAIDAAIGGVPACDGGQQT